MEGDSSHALKSVLSRLAGAGDRRGAPRRKVHGMWCDRGQIIDLSPRGMRITSTRRWREGQHRRVTISDTQRSITLDARCIWCEQEGLFNHFVGLTFDAVTDAQAGALESMAVANLMAATPKND